jgi:hypothetical protein
MNNISVTKKKGWMIEGLNENIKKLTDFLESYIRDPVNHYTNIYLD